MGSVGSVNERLFTTEYGLQRTSITFEHALAAVSNRTRKYSNNIDAQGAV